MASLKPGAAALDIGNELLAPGPAQINVTVVTDPATGAQAALLTVRTSSATVTAWLTRDDAITWRNLIDAKIAAMTTLAVPPRGGLNGGRP